MHRLKHIPERFRGGHSAILAELMLAVRGKCGREAGFQFQTFGLSGGSVGDLVSQEDYFRTLGERKESPAVL